MKKNNVISILAAILIISVTIAIIVTIKKDKRIPIDRDFPISLSVDTNLELPYVNLIAKTIANNVLEYDTLSIIILKMRQEFSLGENITTEAFVLKVPTEDHSYLISISDRVRTRTSLIRVLSHEFAHIKQFESGRMEVININKGIYLWEGDTLDLTTIPYKERPMEKDAFIEGNRIQFAVIPFLYGK